MSFNKTDYELGKSTMHEKSIEANTINFRIPSIDRSFKINLSKDKYKKLKNNTSNYLMTSGKEDEPTEETEITDNTDTTTLRIIINNLRNEIRNKNNELKSIKKNIIEKIKLIENENKATIDGIEKYYKNLIDNINLTNEKKINEINFQNTIIHKNYEEIISKIKIDNSYNKLNNISISEHNEIVETINRKCEAFVEEVKKVYIENLKNLVNYFDRHEYKILLQKMDIYSKLEDKINELDVDNKLKDFINDNHNIFKASISEYDLWTSKMKLKFIHYEKEFIKEINEIEEEYQKTYKNVFLKRNDKLNELKEKIESRFSVNFINLVLRSVTFTKYSQ